MVESKPFGVGGEGNIHKIITSQYKNYCIKIYHARYRTKEKENKISYMVKNPPPKLEDTMFRLCWAKELIYDHKGIFLGFLMPLAFDDSIQLYEITTLKFKKALRSTIWENKFTRATGIGLVNRLKVCLNISAAVYHVHESQKYVFVDFKPQNILINIQGKISITDLDSIQISTGNKVLYRSHVVTPEYTPKESEKIDPKHNQIHETWDRFSLAVMFYENLFGLHPYVGTTNGQYADANTISEKIHHNLCPLGSKRFYFSNPPKQHDYINLFPNTLKTLFLRAFEYGGQDPSKRPSASEWGKELFSIINDPALKKKPIVIPNDIPKQTTHSHPVYPPKPITQPVKPQYKQPINKTSQQTKPVSNDNSGFVAFFLILLICGFIFFIITQTKNSNNLTSEVAVDSTVETIDSTATAATVELPLNTVESTVVTIDSTATAATANLENIYDSYKSTDATGFILFYKGCQTEDDIFQVYIDSKYVGSMLKCYDWQPKTDDYGCVLYTGKAFKVIYYQIKSLRTGKLWYGSVEAPSNETIFVPINAK